MDGNCLEKDFISRTLHILKHYEGPYGVTLLVNCLLGLIVLPKEKDYNHITERGQLHFSDLGIKETDVQWGELEDSKRTAAGLLRCLRNSVAHCQIESLSKDGEIQALRFSDQRGFEAVFRLESLKQIIEKLAGYLDQLEIEKK
ncbi:MAG TPA: HEPN family nuclease [Oscillospiraceae bacterium]|nr:HEPN family nuclease [Oscillospiraceae bacterium]